MEARIRQVLELSSARARTEKGTARRTNLRTLSESVAASARDTRFGIDLVAGRLAEISGRGGGAGAGANTSGSAILTAAFALVLDAQRQGEPVAWITAPESSFFPPDAADGGIDLEALAVVRVPAPRKGTDATAPARAAIHLVRSGAFGLVVLDLVPLQKPYAPPPSIPLPHQTHLVGLAQRHATGVVVLTAKAPEAASVGSLVSLRLDVRKNDAREKTGVREGTPTDPLQGGFEVRFVVIKDKRRGPGREERELCRGPAGLR